MKKVLLIAFVAVMTFGSYVTAQMSAGIDRDDAPKSTRTVRADSASKSDTAGSKSEDCS